MIRLAILSAAGAALAFSVAAPAAQGAPGAPLQTTGAAVLHPAAQMTKWKLGGDRSVRPVRISDDGRRIYVEWAVEQSLPAVFAIGATGAEEVVDGYIRDSLYVIDRIHPKLVFRIDRHKATATRKASTR